MAEMQSQGDPGMDQDPNLLIRCSGVSFWHALERVLALAEAHHRDRLDHPDDHGMNALCLEIVAQHVGGAS
jgi:hypothetical protein